MKKYLIFVFFSVLFSCTSEKEKSSVRLEGFVFGTTYHISLVAETKNDFQKSIDSLFHLVNKSMSTYLPTSDISKINSGDTTIVIDEMFTEVYLKSQKIFQETAGYFDPTVGNLVNAWGFGPGKPVLNLDATQITALMKGVGLQKTKLVNGKILKEDSSIILDFNSIAKGYGVDVISRFLELNHIENYLVEIGGEIRAKGRNLNGDYWKVALENPNTDGTQSFKKIIALRDNAMATSGNYRKFRISKEGEKYVHTVNPKTGLATESNLLSASVIANKDCADVDAYATAFMAMGLEKTKLFVSQHTSIQVILIYANSKGELQEFSTFKNSKE